MGTDELAKSHEKALHARIATLEQDLAELRGGLLLVLDAVDYTSGACGPTERVGGVLPVGVIQRARALADKFRKPPAGASDSAEGRAGGP